MLGYSFKYSCQSSSWVLFLLVAHIATPSIRGQQVPLFDVKNLESNETLRSNFCPIHRLVENGTVLTRNALKDVNIQAAIYRSQLDSETGGIDEVNPPIGIKILDEIARRAKFKWRDSYGVIDIPNENQTWDTVLKQSVDTFDLNGDWHLRTPERLADGINFPEGWYDGSLILVRKNMRETEFAFRFFAFMNPFTIGVWLLIILSSIISGLVYYVIDYILCAGKKDKMEVTIRKSLFEAALTLTGHSLFHPKETGNRLVTFSTCFLFLIITASYTANLTSFLVVRNAPDIVINDIQDVIKNDMPICVMRSSTSDTFMQDRYDTAILVRKDTILDTYLALDSGECKVVLTTAGTWDTEKANIIYNKDCQKERVGREVRHLQAGFSLQDSAQLCSSLFRDVISLHMLEMEIDGTLDTIWNTHRSRSATNNCQEIKASKNDKSIKAKINVKNLGGIFIVHFIALVISLLFAIISTHLRKHKAKLAGSTTKKDSLPVAEYPEYSKKSIAQGPEFSKKEDDLSMTSHHQLEYTKAMKKQTECMESVKKQMSVMQEQLTKLADGKTQ